MLNVFTLSFVGCWLVAEILCPRYSTTGSMNALLSGHVGYPTPRVRVRVRFRFWSIVSDE